MKRRSFLRSSAALAGLTVGLRCTRAKADVTAKRYYIGPWQWVTNNGPPHYAAAAGVLGVVDLGLIPEMSVGGAARGKCLCWTSGDVSLPAEYELLGVGDCREITTDAALLAKFQSLIGYTPEGDRLVDAIYDCLIGGADVDGQSGPMPLVPTTGGEMELWMPGHSRVKAERFKWGEHRQTAKLKQMIRAEFAGHFANAKGGRMKDDRQHLRVLDAWCQKYGVADWKEFVPTNLQRDVPGRVKAETTITESFNTADSDTLGPNRTWTETDGDWDILSNAAVLVTSSALKDARAEHDLSSEDAYAEINVTVLGTGGASLQLGAAIRFNPAARTYYYTGPFQADDKQYTGKVVTGTQTHLASPSITLAIPGVFRVHPIGSTLKAYQDGVERVSLTDTAVTGFLRSGIFGYNAGTPSPQGDNFEASDGLSGGGDTPKGNFLAF